MLENRNCYGYGSGRGERSKSDLQKWQIAYKNRDGFWGIIGWICLFDDYDDALAYGERFMAETSYVTEIKIQHPSKYYSNY